MSHMTAARWWGPRDVRVERVTVPTPAADEALVAVTWVGLCGSDLEEYLEGPVVAVPPRVLGHEVVGEVVEAAPDGSGPPAGTPVVVDVVTGCGSCWWCARHEEGLCPDLVVTGQHRDGGLAELVAARANRLVRIPDGLEPRRAALAEPLAVAVRAVRTAGDLEGQQVLVLGGGTVGMLVAQVARHAGARMVVVLEPSEPRRETFSRWEFTAGWHSEPAGRADWLQGALGGRLPDVVIESAGAPSAGAEAVRLCRVGGTTVLLGVTKHAEAIDLLDVVLSEKTVRGSAAHMWDIDVEPAVAMLADGVVDVDPIISHTFPLDGATSAFELLATPGAGALKILVEVRP